MLLFVCLFVCFKKRETHFQNEKKIEPIADWTGYQQTDSKKANLSAEALKGDIQTSLLCPVGLFLTIPSHSPRVEWPHGVGITVSQ